GSSGRIEPGIEVAIELARRIGLIPDRLTIVPLERVVGDTAVHRRRENPVWYQAVRQVRHDNNRGFQYIDRFVLDDDRRALFTTGEHVGSPYHIRGGAQVFHFRTRIDG